jgi:hypothetical protein
MGQTTLNWRTSDFGTFGRYTEIPVMTSEQRKGFELVARRQDQDLHPHQLQALAPVGKYFRPATYDPVREPEVVGGGRMFDDFCIDQDAGFAYLTTHRRNTIDRLSLEPAENSGAGPLGRQPGEYGRVAFLITDGGPASPPEAAQPAKLVKVELLTEAAVR